MTDSTIHAETREERLREEKMLAMRWHGWASPVGLGVGLVCVGAFWALFTLGLSVLAATPY